MRVFTTNGDSFEFDGPPPPIEDIKSFISEYELTISSQQKLALLYYNANQPESCLELLRHCLSMNLFSTENSDLIKLTLLAFYIETDTEREEASGLFSQLETTSFQKELKILKGYYLFSQQKYDTALFCLEDDVSAKNMIFLAKKHPEKVETTDPLFNGYKQYLMGDIEGAIKHFKVEYEKNKRVLVYLLRLSPERFADKKEYPIEDWMIETTEYKLLEISKIKNTNEREEKLGEYYNLNEKIKDEFLYQKGKRLHLEKSYEEALEYYIQCESQEADYQVKRILGIKHESCKDLIELQKIKSSYRNIIDNPVNEFNKLKKIRGYIDECTYYNNRGYSLYFIENPTEHVLNEIKEDLQDTYDFSVGPVISYFNRALDLATAEQKKAVRYNKDALENKEFESIDHDLSDAIQNLRNNPDNSLRVFISYLSGDRGEISDNISKVVASGVGICLALKGDKFARKIFEYLNDQTNLNAFHKNFSK